MINKTVYAAGSTFTVPVNATPQAVEFGTQSPEVVVSAPNARRYIRCGVLISLQETEFQHPSTLTLRLRRTNNTIGVIANTTTAVSLNTSNSGDSDSGLSNTEFMVELPPVSFMTTATGNDHIQLEASLDVAPQYGDVKIVDAWMILEQA